MRIEDDELREVFKEETTERLDRMENYLLRLEKEFANQEFLTELYRDAHSLKGAARLVEQPEMEKLCHSLEDVLAGISNGTMEVSSSLVTKLSRMLDSLRLLAEQAIGGEQTTVQIEKNKSETNQDNLIHQLESVRVSTNRLDHLLQEAGELIVIQYRQQDHCQRVDRIRERLEEISRFADGGLDKHIDASLRANAKQLEELLLEVDDLYIEMTSESERLTRIAEEIREEVQGMRLLPLTVLFQHLPRMVRDISLDQGKKVELLFRGEDIQLDKFIIEQMKDPLNHLVRNAIDHGIESPQKRLEKGKTEIAALRILATQSNTHINIEVADDGNGLNLERIKSIALEKGLRTESELADMNPSQLQVLIFEHGFSTKGNVSNISGRGIGLDVVKNTVEKLKGSLSVASEPGKGCCFQLRLPISLMTTSVIVVESGGCLYGIPTEFVGAMTTVQTRDIFPTEGKQTIYYGEEAVSLTRLSVLLELGDNNFEIKEDKKYPCIIVSNGDGEETARDKVALLVDKFITESPVIVKPLSAMLRRVRNVLGVTILSTGDLCMVLNPYDLVRTVQKGVGIKAFSLATVAKPKKPHLLVADDSITTRVQIRRILEGGGYQVTTCIDGEEAWKTLNQQLFDAVVTDVEMPNLDGFSLTERIRQSEKWADLPVVLVTSLMKESDKKRGIAVKANAYFVKSAFDQDLLLETIARFV